MTATPIEYNGHTFWTFSSILATRNISLDAYNMLCYVSDPYTELSIDVLLTHRKVLVECSEKIDSSYAKHVSNFLTNAFKFKAVKDLFATTLEFKDRMSMALSYIVEHAKYTEVPMTDYTRISDIAWEFKCTDGTVWMHKNNQCMRSSGLITDIQETLDISDPSIQCPYTREVLTKSIEMGYKKSHSNPEIFKALRWLNPSIEYINAMIPCAEKPKDPISTLESIVGAQSRGHSFICDGDIFIEIKETQQNTKHSRLHYTPGSSEPVAISVGDKLYYSKSVIKAYSIA